MAAFPLVSFNIHLSLFSLSLSNKDDFNLLSRAKCQRMDRPVSASHIVHNLLLGSTCECDQHSRCNVPSLLKCSLFYERHAAVQLISHMLLLPSGARGSFFFNRPRHQFIQLFGSCILPMRIPCNSNLFATVATHLFRSRGCTNYKALF